MTALFAGAVTLEIDVAFENDATDPTPTWTDITRYVKEFTFSRGRQTELEQTEPGSASFVLKNQDRRFDPFYTSSPYYPYVEPMKQVRIRATYSAVVYDLWRGYVDSWPQSWDGHGKVSEVTMTATDAFKIFAQIDCPENAWAAQVAMLDPSAWYKFSEAAEALVAFDSSLNGNDATYEQIPATGIDGIMEEPGADKGFAPLHDAGAQRAQGHNSLLLTGYPFSVSAVFKVLGHPTSFKTIMAGIDGATGGAHMDVAIYGEGTGVNAYDGVIETTVHDGTNARAAYFQNTDQVNEGDRHHVLVVWNNTTTVHLYRDGVSITPAYSTIGTGSPTFPNYIQTGWSFGNYPKVSFGDYGFADDITTDLLDDVAVWGLTALSAQNAADLSSAMRGWVGDLSSDRVTRMLDFAGYPSGLRDIDTGQTTLTNASFSGTVLDYLLKIADSEYGNVYMTGAGDFRFRSRHSMLTDAEHTTSQATFSDDGTDLPYHDLEFANSDLLIRNDIAVQRAGATEQRAIDSTSQTRYLKRGYKRSGELMETDTEARAQAEWILAHYKDPTERVAGISIKPRRSATLWPEVLGRELEDRITIERRPPGGGSAIVHEALVEKITHHVDADSVAWDVTWQLSPADTQAYFLIGDTTFGRLDQNRLAY